MYIAWVAHYRWIREPDGYWRGRVPALGVSSFLDLYGWSAVGMVLNDGGFVANGVLEGAVCV